MAPDVHVDDAEAHFADGPAVTSIMTPDRACLVTGDKKHHTLKFL